MIFFLFPTFPLLFLDAYSEYQKREKIVFPPLPYKTLYCSYSNCLLFYLTFLICGRLEVLLSNRHAYLYLRTYQCNQKTYSHTYTKKKEDQTNYNKMNKKNILQQSTKFLCKHFVCSTKLIYNLCRGFSILSACSQSLDSHAHTSCTTSIYVYFVEIFQYWKFILNDIAFGGLCIYVSSVSWSQ